MQQTINTLNNSGIILTPTDTTFGLSCLAFDKVAINKLLTIKNRPTHKNFIILVENEARLQRHVEVPDIAWDLIDLSDKPITIVYDKILDLPQHLISSEGTVAIRICNYQPLQRVIQKCQQPLISTSANIANDRTPFTFDEINPAIIESVNYVVPDSVNFKQSHPSSIIIQVSHDQRVKVLRA